MENVMQKFRDERLPAYEKTYLTFPFLQDIVQFSAALEVTLSTAFCWKQLPDSNPLKRVIRVMGRFDLTNKKTKTEIIGKTPSKSDSRHLWLLSHLIRVMYRFFLRQGQIWKRFSKVIQNTCDPLNLWLIVQLYDISNNWEKQSQPSQWPLN